MPSSGYFSVVGLDRFLRSLSLLADFSCSVRVSVLFGLPEPFVFSWILDPDLSCFASAADPRIPDPNFSIADLESKRHSIPDPVSGSATKNLSIFNQKFDTRLADMIHVYTGGFFHTGPPNADPGSGSATLYLTYSTVKFEYRVHVSEFVFDDSANATVDNM